MADLIHMEIGDVWFSIRAAGKISQIIHAHDPAYESFFRKVNKGGHPAAVKINVRLESEWGTMPDIEALPKIFDSGQSWVMHQDEGVYWMTRKPPIDETPVWVVRFDRDIKEVTVYCGKKLIRERDGKTMVSNPVRYPLDQLLLMYILAQNKGALVHAAGMSIHGKGLLFPGPSGAGKSTLSRQFTYQKDPGVEIFSDDRMVVRKVEGTFKAYGTPWPGEQGIALNKRMPLSGIFFLHHGIDGGNRIKKIKPQKALEALLQVTSIPWYDRDVMPRVLRFCDDLVSNVPCFDLYFTPGIEVVKSLEEFKKY
jgi:hypothetical protein